MPEYNILAQIKIDPTSVRSELNKISKSSVINVKAKITDADKLATTLGKIDNQLERIKINNKDAFDNSQVVRDSYNETVKLRDALSKGEASLGQYQVQFGKTNNEIARYNQESRTTISHTDNLVSSLGKAITKIALWGVATGILYGSLRNIQNGIQYVKDLNEAMTDTQIVTGYTKSQIAELSNNYNNLAKELGVTTLEVADGALEWQRQGKTVAETQKLLRASVMMAKLANMDQAASTEALTSIINGYKLSIDEVIPTIDKLVALDNNFATSTQEISDALTKVSAVSKQSNISLEEMAAMITVVSSDTRIAAESVGQSFKTILMRMQNVKLGKYLSDEGEDISDVEKVLSSLGIELRDDTDTWRDFSDVLVDVQAKWTELGKEGKTVEQSMLVNAFAGQRQANILTDLLNNQDKYNEALKVEAAALGTTESRYAIYQDSVEFAANKSKAAWEKVWQTTINNDVIKFFYNVSAAIAEVISAVGGLIPIIMQLGGALIALNFASVIKGVTNVVSSLKLMFAVISVGAAATATEIAVATAGISLIVGGIILAISSLVNASDALEDATGKLSESQSKLSELQSKKSDIEELSEAYQKLASNTERSAEQEEEFVRIQNQLKDLLPGIAGYYDQSGNFVLDPEALSTNQAYLDILQKQIDAEKELISIQAEKVIAAGQKGYEKAAEKVKIGTSTEEFAYRALVTITDEEIAQAQASMAELIRTAYESYLQLDEDSQDAFKISLEGMGEYGQKVLEIINGAVESTSESIENVGEVASETKMSIEDLVSSMDAIAKASSEQAKEGKISYSTALDLISANASLAQYLTMTADGYIFDAEAARAATQAEMINEFTKYGLRDAAIAAANGNYVFAQSAIASSNATNAEKESMLSLLKAFAAMSVKVSVPFSGGGSAISEQEKLNNLKKEEYKLEIDNLNARKKSAQRQIDALNDLKDAYKEIIDAKKESLKLAKEESDYNDELQDKNEELADIENKLFAIQFDNSQKANAKRLQLEEEKAKKMEEIAQFQADRTYEIQIDALDKEYDAYEKMIDAQISAIELVIDGFDAMIDKINEMISALSKLSTAQSGGGYVLQKTSAPKVLAKPDGRRGRGISPASEAFSPVFFPAFSPVKKTSMVGYSSGGSGKVPSGYPNDSALIPVESGEVFAILNKSQQEKLSVSSPLSSLFSVLAGGTQKPTNLTSSTGEGIQISFGDINVQGNLDKVTLADVKEAATSATVEALRRTGIMRGAKSFTV